MHARIHQHAHDGQKTRKSELVDLAMGTTNRAGTAAATFMATSELVEHMLLRLPLRKIITVQITCKSWEQVIQTSPQIQKALFFRPSADIRLRLVETRGVYPLECRTAERCPRYNSKGAGPTDGGDGYTRWAVNGSDEKSYRILVNPFLEWSAVFPGLFPYMERSSDSYPLDVYRRPEASWRKMLLTQPPLSEAIVNSRGRHACHWHIIRAKQHSRGLNLGDARSHVPKFHSLRNIWGEDGFTALAVGNVATPSDISGQAMIDEILRSSGEEVEAESSDDVNDDKEVKDDGGVGVSSDDDDELDEERH